MEIIRNRAHSRTPSYDAWREAMHPEDRANAEEVVAEAARNGTELNVEFRVCDRDGTIRWLMSRGRPLRGGKGRPARFVGIVLDITARRRVEEAMRAREADLRRFAEFAPVAIAMFDREMRYLAASRRFRDDYGLGEQEVLGRSHYDVFPEIPEQLARDSPSMSRGSGRAPSRRAVSAVRRREQWIRGRSSRGIRPTANIGGIVLFSEEITRQHTIEEDLRQTSQQRQLALEAANLGSWDYRFETGDVFWDDTCRNMFGLAKRKPDRLRRGDLPHSSGRFRSHG